jgi:putative modified peptide
MSHLNSEQALQLVRRLANDPAFRQRFQDSPKDALEEMHLPSAFAACCTGVRLPSADTLAATEQALVADMTSRGTQQVIGLSAK